MKQMSCRLAALILLLGVAGKAHASMTLTPSGVAQGFSLSTFASGFPSDAFGEGPFGIAFPASGKVLVGDVFGNIRIFDDTDGQSAGSAPIGASYGIGGALGLTQTGGSVYMAAQSFGSVFQLNDDGSFNHTVASGLAFPTGIAVDPTNGHLFVSERGGAFRILDIDPVTMSVHTVTSVGVALDGLTVSADGKTVYVSQDDGTVRGYDTTTGAEVFNSGFLTFRPDGLVLGTGPLSGLLFANTTDGQLIEIDTTSLVQTLIATGGSRGDFVNVDPHDGSLLLTQTDSVLRLTPPGGGFLTPEPSSLATAVLGAMGLAGYAVRRRTRPA